MRHRLTLLSCLLLAAPRPASATFDHAAFARTFMAAHSERAGLPSYARQTGLACSACHFQFLALTPFGRQFKLNGYTLTGLPPITETSPANGGQLSITPMGMLSAMVTASVTQVARDLPDQQNGVAMLPQEISLFLAGRISPKLGIFSQLTYGAADGTVGVDNIDLRFADHGTLGGTSLAYGMTLNNNPSIQDLWNSTPAWGVPFIGAEGAPTPTAAALIDGTLAQNVFGLGGYALVDDHVYGELSLYRSSFQGTTAPSSATGAIRGLAPYWRLGLQQAWGDRYVMVGTFGVRAATYPDVLSGPRDTYLDLGMDAQYESKLGKGNLVVRGMFLHEKQSLAASYGAGSATNPENTLKVTRVNATWYPTQRYSLTGGAFDTRGSADAGRYPDDPVTGSASGDPKSTGFLGEFDFNPWENTRLGLQYTAYSTFNGRSTNYDTSGRDASGNNTLFAFLWMAF